MGRFAPPFRRCGRLAAQTAETVTTAAVTEHLQSLGLTTICAHAAITLGRFARQGLLARLRRGVYRINRFHPELLAMRQGAEPAPSAIPTSSAIPAKAGIPGSGERVPPSRE